jgi:hypothetical protein
MRQRRVVTVLGSLALIALSSGCATHRTDAVASRTESDASRSSFPNELVGTWTGWFRPVGGADGGGGNAMAGDMTLEIKDDATYTLTSTRRGRGDAAGRVSNDSGVVVANGRGITLKSSSGQWIPLMRNGESLYGVSTHWGSSGYTMQITVERDSGSFASPRPRNDQQPKGH